MISLNELFKYCMFLFLSSIAIEGASTVSFFKTTKEQLKKQILTNLQTKKQFCIHS